MIRQLLILVWLLWSISGYTAEPQRWLVIATQPLDTQQLAAYQITVLAERQLGKVWRYTLVFQKGEEEAQKQQALLKQLPNVRWVEPDQQAVPEAVPNDVGANLSWWQAVEAAALNESQRDCSGVLIAILDSGIDIAHPDLQGVIWQNPDEQPNGVDDDGNGYVDDVYGWDALSGQGVTGDAYGHGTHVAGIIGAVNENQTGVAGLCSPVQILPLRFLNNFGSGYISDAIEALQYLVDLIEQGQLHGYRVVLNNSWVIGSYSLAFEIMLDVLHAHGVLVVNASGNQGLNIDQRLVYPASFARNRLWQMSVGNAYVTESRLAGSSNYGVHTVSVSAPGVDVLSTWPGDEYQTETGTSMAAPVVSALSAMVWRQHAQWSAAEVRAVVEAGVRAQDTFIGKIKSRGWVNFSQSLGMSEPVPMLGYMESGKLKGVALAQIASLSLGGNPLSFRYDAQADEIELTDAAQLKCGYLATDDMRVKPLYLDILPAAPASFTVKIQNNQWLLSWQSEPNVDAVRLEGLSAVTGRYETIVTLDDAAQSATVPRVAGYTQLRLVALMRCEGEDLQLVERASAPSAAFNIEGVPLWQTRALSPAQVGVPYAVQLSVEGAYQLSFGENHTCGGMTLNGRFLEGILQQLGTCQVEVVADALTTEPARLRLLLDVQPDTLSYFTLADGTNRVQLDLSGISGVLGVSLEQTETGTALRIVTQADASGVLQLAVGSATQFFEPGVGAYTLTPDQTRAQAVLSELMLVEESADKKVYLLPFSLGIRAAPVYKTDSRCFFSSYLFGKNAWQTRLLRQVRDKVLLQVPGGAKLVRWYYANAPVWLSILQPESMLVQSVKFVMQRVLSPWLALGVFFQANRSHVDAGI